MAVKKRRVSKEYLQRLWQELENVSAVARRIGYTRTGAFRALRRHGIRK